MTEKYKTSYHYENGYAIFTIHYKDCAFSGDAKCHPDDMDMESERTGLTIAEARAHIHMMKFIKRHEIQPVVDTYHHLLKNIQSSKKHDPRAYESCMLRSQLAHWENRLAEIEADIADEEKYLKEYINQKDKLYKRLRARNQ